VTTSSPQDPANPNPRHLATTTATTPSGSNEMASWAFKGWVALCDYLNEGGKGRVLRPQRARAVPEHAAEQRRRRPAPAHRFQTLVPVSNDVLQYYFGVTARTNNSGYGRTNLDAGAVSLVAGGRFDGLAPCTVDTGSGNDPNQDVDRIGLPRAKSLTRLRSWSGVAVQKPLRRVRRARPARPAAPSSSPARCPVPGSRSCAR
jgi:hypothetical protein